MAISNAVSLANFTSGDTLIIDSVNDRVGIASTAPTTTLDVNGTVKATSFEGDGANLTGVSGFADVVSSDTSSPLNSFFTTPEQLNISAGTSITMQSNAASGNLMFCREGIVHVAVGATVHVQTGTTVVTNVLRLF